MSFHPLVEITVLSCFHHLVDRVFPRKLSFHLLVDRVLPPPGGDDQSDLLPQPGGDNPEIEDSECKLQNMSSLTLNFMHQVKFYTTYVIYHDCNFEKPK